ncbi:MAG: hypothetical protein NTW96_24950 [Planctomycetia bacterium]|nr:hypothetical protein [Planctomycetia bacterium]
MKWFSCVLCVFALVVPSRASQADESEFLRQLKERPAESPEAAGWFASLPIAKKRAVAAKIGQIVLDSPDSPDFGVAFGASGSPYPWVLIVRDSPDDRLHLYGGNYFKCELRDDKRVKRHWEAGWYNVQHYDTRSSDGRVVFEKIEDKKQDLKNLFGVWVEPRWRYVGPELPQFGPKTEQERIATREIRKLGGRVYVDIRLTEYRATAVSLPPGATDDALKHVKDLPELQDLFVAYGNLTDGSMENVKDLTSLRVLFLGGMKITDAGLKHLKGLIELRDLNLQDTKITDVGLENLTGLTQLETLNLSNTKVTDAGLEHLKGLGKLRELNLLDTRVSDLGVEKLQKALPKCKIRWHPGE